MSVFSQIVEFLRALVSTPLTYPELEGALDKLASENPEKLDWRNSIVDLMKLTNQDSGLKNREKLAQELGYPGPYNGSADMNVWLHQQVMDELAKTLPR